MLVKLKQRFAPTDQARERELIMEWKRLQKAPSGVQIDDWLMKWETSYDECLIKQLPDVQGTRPVYDFVSAVSSIAPGFSDVWDVKLAEGQITDLKTVVRNFRDYRRTNQTRAKPLVQGSFATDTPNQGTPTL
jgi:hypothetical protein